MKLSLMCRVLLCWGHICWALQISHLCWVSLCWMSLYWMPLFRAQWCTFWSKFCKKLPLGLQNSSPNDEIRSNPVTLLNTFDAKMWTRNRSFLKCESSFHSCHYLLHKMPQFHISPCIVVVVVVVVVVRLSMRNKLSYSIRRGGRGRGRGCTAKLLTVVINSVP